MFNQLIINFNSWITNSVSDLVNYFTKTETIAMIDGNRTESETNLRIDIDGNWSDLEERKLNVTLYIDSNLSSGGEIDGDLTINGFLNITGNFSINNVTEEWNGTCFNTYIESSLVQSIGCLV